MKKGKKEKEEKKREKSIYNYDLIQLLDNRHLLVRRKDVDALLQRLDKQRQALVPKVLCASKVVDVLAKLLRDEAHVVVLELCVRL